MSGTGWFRERYGASPLHLLLVLTSFALAGYAGVRLLEGDTLLVAVWFVAAALLHDLVLLPLYSVTDRCAQRVCRSAGLASARPSVNYLRVPGFLSGLLLLVWWPLVFEQVGHYTAYTGLPSGVFLGRWLLLSAALFAGSAIVLLIRMGRRGQAAGLRRQSAGRARGTAG
ncbi:hypothetical protein [Streptomyces zhihengii]